MAQGKHRAPGNQQAPSSNYSPRHSRGIASKLARSAHDAKAKK